MLPILFKIGPLTIHTYGFMLALGVACGLWFLYVQGKKQNMNAAKLLDLTFYTIIISLIGAKFVLFVGNFSTYMRRPGELFSLARSGGVFQGGLAFGILFALWYMRRHEIKIWKTADIMTPALALGHAFGRIGCFSAGCCYGRICDLPWGVTFHNEYASEITGIPLNTALHPVQLYEAGLNFLNFLVLFFILKKKKFDGQVFLFYIVIYSIIRYFTEFFRGDHADKTYILKSASPYLSISLPQMFALAGFVVGITLLAVLFKKKRARV
jgi:phosphatidylglycerol:prolipoprotein diacylglycerol transferase